MKTFFLLQIKTVIFFLIYPVTISLGSVQIKISGGISINFRDIAYSSAAASYFPLLSRDAQETEK